MFEGRSKGSEEGRKGKEVKGVKKEGKGKEGKGKTHCCSPLLLYYSIPKKETTNTHKFPMRKGKEVVA